MPRRSSIAADAVPLKKNGVLSGSCLVGRQIPTGTDIAACRTILTFLLRVGPLDLAVGQRDFFGRITLFVIGRAELFNLGDQHLFELDFHVLDLVATGATELDGNFLDVLAGTASFKKLGRCLIQLMNEVEGAVIDTFRRRAAD